MMEVIRKQFWRWLPLCLAILTLTFFTGDICPAAAAEDGGSHSGSHNSGHSGKGGRGGSMHDSGSVDHHGGSHITGNHGGHSGNKSVTGDRGRRPVWAQEGLPEVELGRLNAARAPGHVLSRALAEAHTTLTNDPLASIHSPPQNLALYWEAMTSPGSWTRQQAASFLGAAADKRIPITADTVIALNLILGVSEADPASMAEAADNVRQQLLAEHDQGTDTDGSVGH